MILLKFILILLLIILIILFRWYHIKDKLVDKKGSENKSFPTTHKDVINKKITAPELPTAKKEPTLKVQANNRIDWSTYVIENSGGYYNAITNDKNLSFSHIRKYCAEKIGGNSQQLPQRGVVPLITEGQLNQYIYSYGNMHYAKLCDAISVLPDSLRQEKLHIIDWGCGQGIASFTFLTKRRTSSVAITLIEPGILALKRAALNLKEAHKRYSSGAFRCRTLNKDFDSIRREDLNVELDSCKIHFFSNVLDIENRYSLEQLIELIKATLKGKNYFVCVSPYQNEEKKKRICSFVDAFRNCDDFTLYYSVENKREDVVWKCNNRFKGYSPGQYCIGECDTCEHKWTRIIRVFSVNL